jgi:hypothetical protein
MAERRMFAKTIIDSDAFLDMSMSAQALYFHLAMRADDDGFVNNPKKIQRMVGAPDDDLKILRAKRFIIAFESGVIVIKHWKIHNYIQGDRYKPTVYQSEKAMLAVKDNRSYTENLDGIRDVSKLEAECIHDVSKVEAQYSIGKDSLGKDSIVPGKPEKTKIPPSFDEVRVYCADRKNNIDPHKFIDYYETRGWLLGKTKMKDWKAAIRTWEGNASTGGKKVSFQNYGECENTPVVAGIDLLAEARVK